MICAKMAELIETPLGCQHHMGLRDPELDGRVQIPHGKWQF